MGTRCWDPVPSSTSASDWNPEVTFLLIVGDTCCLGHGPLSYSLLVLRSQLNHGKEEDDRTRGSKGPYWELM